MVIARTSGALVALMALMLGACSEENSSSTSTAAKSARDTVVASPPTLESNSTPATAKILPEPATTTASATGAPTTQVVVPTIAPSTGGSAAPQQSTTTSSPPLPPGALTLLDKDCTAEHSDSGYDLLHATVESLPSRYRLTAQYSGDTFQRDILVSFDLSSSSYVVTGELFEDGKGVARVADTGASESLFLDAPQTIAPGLVALTVRTDQVAGISGAPFDGVISLKVDGAKIESCE
jgi:hypothetical protein